MSRVPRAWPALAAAALAALVFVNAIGGEFVYDDHRFYAGNDALVSWDILWRAFADPVAQTADGTHAGLWRPLRTLSFAADRLVFGDAVWGPHLVNVLLHAAGTGLVTTLLRRLGGPPVAAFLGGLLYAFHPAQVEVVAWISSRGDLLAAGLVWGAILLALAERPVAGVIAGGLALLAKEQAVVWPALVFVAFLADGVRVRTAGRRVVVPVAVVLLFVAVRHALLAEPLQEGGLGGGAVGLPTLAAMLGHQAWSLLVPVGTLFDWQMPVPVRGAAALATPLVATLVLAGLIPRATRAATLWFLVALVPTLFIQLLVPLNIHVADRFLLFALPALALLAVRVARSRPGALAVGLAAVCLALLTPAEVAAWSDETSLWTRTAERCPGHWRAESWLGLRAIEGGDAERAVVHLERAATAGPADAKTRYRLAEALEILAGRAPPATRSELTRRARDEYVACLRLYASGARQEGQALLEPLAMLTMIDLTLALGETDRVEAMLYRRLQSPPPPIPEAARAAWDRRVELLAGHLEEFLDPRLESPLAPRVRQWAASP